MKRNWFWWIAGAVVIALGLGGAGLLQSGIVEKSAPVTQAPAATPITADWVAQNALYGVAGMDAREFDFTPLPPADLALLTFDTKTRWPDPGRLPKGFQPAVVLEEAKDPGLGLRQLHTQGITGKGISVAMIDKAILPDHRELAGHIQYITVSPETTNGRDPHFHGMATASILVGKEVGVAPGAFLYYFSVPNDQNGFKNYVTALEQLLAFNETLPTEKKIRVVSVSWGPTNKGTREAWPALVEKARAQGMEVVYSMNRTTGDYTSTGALPGKDRNDPNAYDWAPWVLKNSGNRSLLTKQMGVPTDYRTTASVAGPDEYVYWGEGGMSWAMPYAAGLLTLGLQANPNATFDDLWIALDKTATPNAQGVRMVNPAAYIAAVR